VDAFAGPSNTTLKLARDAGWTTRSGSSDRPRRGQEGNGRSQGNDALLDRLNSAIAGFRTTGNIRLSTRGGTARETLLDHRKAPCRFGLFLVLNIVTMAFWRYRSLLRLNAELRENVARRMQVEEALKKYSADLEKTTGSCSTSPTSLHDLQEPLRMVSSYLQLIASRYRASSTGRRRIHRLCVDGALRMKGMIEGLLAYTRVQTAPNRHRPSMRRKRSMRP